MDLRTLYATFTIDFAQDHTRTFLPPPHTTHTPVRPKDRPRPTDPPPPPTPRFPHIHWGLFFTLSLSAFGGSRSNRISTVHDAGGRSIATHDEGGITAHAECEFISVSFVFAVRSLLPSCQLLYYRGWLPALSSPRLRRCKKSDLISDFPANQNKQKGNWKSKDEVSTWEIDFMEEIRRRVK